MKARGGLTDGRRAWGAETWQRVGLCKEENLWSFEMEAKEEKAAEYKERV